MTVWLRKQGMSTRAISAATGASKGTVQNDTDAGAQNWAPDDNEPIDVEIVGLDGKTYTPPAPSRPKRETPPTVKCPICGGTGAVPTDE